MKCPQIAILAEFRAHVFLYARGRGLYYNSPDADNSLYNRRRTSDYSLHPPLSLISLGTIAALEGPCSNNSSRRSKRILFGRQTCSALSSKLTHKTFDSPVNLALSLYINRALNANIEEIEQYILTSILRFDISLSSIFISWFIQLFSFLVLLC